MTYNAYTSINSLDEIPLIAGNQMTLTFNTYEEDGVTPLDISGCAVKFGMSPYGQEDYSILIKDGTLASTTSFSVVLNSSDTINLYGKYIYQPLVIFPSGEYHRPAQGQLLVQARVA